MTGIRGGARHRPQKTAAQPCIRSIREDRNHDAVMRIAGEAREQRAHPAQRPWKPWFTVGSPPPRIHRQTLVRTAKPLALLFLSFRTVAHGTGRRPTPCGTWPVVARRQRAISSLRASATIMVLRVPPRPSAVRAVNHWARALFF